jgi:hypothetical protein
MPELFITKRKENAEKITMWKAIYRQLSMKEREEFKLIVKDNVFPERNLKNKNIQKLYECYYK